MESRAPQGAAFFIAQRQGAGLDCIHCALWGVPMIRKTVVVLAAALGLAACAGFKSGTMLAPYYEGTAPPTDQPGTIHEIDRARTLTHDGMEITIRLADDVRTSDVQVMLAVVPTSVKLGDRGANPEGAPLRLELSFMNGARPASIVPGAVRLTVNGQSLAPLRVGMGGQTKRALGLGQRVTLGAKSFNVVQFDFAPVSDLSAEGTVLHLSPALDGLRGTIPPIRFKTLRWKYGYT